MKTEFSKVTVNKRVDRSKKGKGRNKCKETSRDGTATSLGTNNREAPFPPQPSKGRRRTGHHSKTENELEGCMGRTP